MSASHHRTYARLEKLSIMENRNDMLGFTPQKETPYNKLLPYAHILDAESIYQLAEIKANLGRTVLLRDIKIGACHWTGQLAKYIRLFGQKFSKEDHLTFIWLLFELTTIPDLDYSLVQKFSTVLINLLKKKELISREDLILPWRPLYNLLEGVAYSRYEHHGLVLLPSNIENVLKGLIRVSRTYFSEEATQEMLDEWRPLMCPFDVTMLKAMYYFELFLPTSLPPESHHKGFKLWLYEFLDVWDTCQNSPGWEASLVNLFARVAMYNIGYIDWGPYLPKILTRMLRSFNLPVGSNKILVSNKNNNCYDIISSTTWLASMLGGNCSVQEHISKMFKALESFYHPSNFGKWNAKLMRLMMKLPHSVVKRYHREKHPNEHWEYPVPDSHKLSNDDITQFVLSMKPIVFLAMFSKIGSHESAIAMDQLAQLRPEIIIPPLLEHTYPALETLTEPHRLIASLNCTITVARSMLNSQRWYPEGRTHVIPLLNLSLPGIDPNDIKKCLTTFQLVSTYASLVPLVDCSQAINVRTDLTETERELCSASAQFEDFVLLFMDKVFALIENSSQEHTRSDSNAADRLTHEETMMEVGLLSSFNAVMQQSSAPIYKSALHKLFRFVSTSVFEIRVAGRFASDLCRAAAKVHPEMALKLFVTHFCRIIKSRTDSEDLSKEEHLDDEFLWNLKLLSETVRCDGHCLLPYRAELIAVLSATLHMKCKDGAELAGHLLRHVLKALTLTYACDYRSTPEGWDRPLSEYLPIRDWGKPGDIKNLQLKWHVPSAEEKAFASELLETFILPELESIEAHVAGTKKLSREELVQTLSILVHSLVGAGNALPMWQAESVHLVDCLVDLTRFSNTASNDTEGISLRGHNVRQLIANTMRPLLDHLLSESEDDTKSLLQLVRVYNSIMFYHGTQKDDFDGRWKSLHIVKKSMENRFLGKKRHIRAVLVDRVQLQHELRIINRNAKVYTAAHQQLFSDLFRLSISRYGEVRKSSQSVLSHGFHLYAYSYRSLLDKVLVCLKESPDVTHQQFKGALYIVRGEHKRSLMTKRNWEVMNKVWLSVVQAQHSEKPSVLRLIDDITDKLHKNIESTEIAITVHDGLLKAGKRVWDTQSVTPSRPCPSDNEMKTGLQEEVLRNKMSLRSFHMVAPQGILKQGIKHTEQVSALTASAGSHDRFSYGILDSLQASPLLSGTMIKHHVSDNIRLILDFCTYRLLVDNLIAVISDGKLHWKFHQLAIQMLGLLIRHDVSPSPQLVDTFVKNMVNDTLAIRKISVSAVSAILKAEKRPHKKVVVDPYMLSGTKAPTGPVSFCDRPDNMWHHYNSSNLPDTEEKWNSTVFIEKTHWGYYHWPKQLQAYAPPEDQPPLGRTLNELLPEERPIYEHFSDPVFIDKLVKFMCLEEHKGKDKFRSKHFTLFKGLFRNFDDAFIPLLRPHMERMVADTKHDSHEYCHRLAAEMIAGIIRGCKHWTYTKLSSMWAWLVPVMKTGIGNITVESLGDWGTCYATAAESRDPRKLSPMLEVLMENPLNGDGGSFGDSSRLYILQGALAQQEWRVPELLNRHWTYVANHLTHTYKNVRDRLGSVLVNLLMYDLPMPHSRRTVGPRREDFLTMVLPQLQILLDPPGSNSTSSSPASGKASKSARGLPVWSASSFPPWNAWPNGSATIPIAMEIDDNGSARLDTVSVGDVEMGVLETDTPPEHESSGTSSGSSSSNDTLRKVMEAGSKLLGKNFNNQHGESEERKAAVRLCKTGTTGEVDHLTQPIRPVQIHYSAKAVVTPVKTKSFVMKWVQGGCGRMPHMTPPEVFDLIPILCNLESESKDDELRDGSFVTMACLAQILLPPDIIAVVLEIIKQVAHASSWHARASILGYMQVMTFCNLFIMQDPQTVSTLQDITIQLLCDEQVEVREMAAVTLGGFLHCGYMKLNKDMMSQFESLSRTKVKKNKKADINPERVIKRHAGVLGLSACVLAFPYDVPEFIPQILMDLSDHLGDPQPIQLTVKKTLSNFRRTHYDNWQDHKQKFTDDQLVVLTDLLVSPNYYA